MIFLDLMHHSAACVKVESTCCHGFCQIKLRLWKCSFCNHTLFTTFLTVRDESDLKHLAHYLDLIQRMWKYYTTTKTNLIRSNFSDKSNNPVMDNSGTLNHLSDHQLTSSNLVELKQLQSSTKNSVEKLDYISTIASNVPQEFLKFKKSAYA